MVESIALCQQPRSVNDQKLDDVPIQAIRNCLMGGQGQANEGERRIRAAVRALMSPGVWLVVAVQLPTAMLIHNILLSEESAKPLLPWVMLLTLLFLVYVYLMSGTSRSFALSAVTVSPQDAFMRGQQVFNAFLWLAVKICLLGMLTVYIGLYVFGTVARIIGATTGSGAEAVIQASAPALIPIVKAAAMVAPFALVYWLPVVFIRNDFRIIPTARLALKIIWRQLPRSGFLAFLIFCPLLLLWLLPNDIPFVFTLLLGALGQLMAWTAYVYCVETLLANPGWLPPKLSP
jgi:hypothetical protein